jgi:hypothetical protein
MKIRDILQEDVDKATFVKLLKNKGTYDITTTGSKFDAKIIEPYGSTKSKEILKTQQAKVDTAAEVLGVQWKILYANRFMQGSSYMTSNKHSHPAWTYVLVGEDDKGNEVAYWKYEGAVAGGGQSHIFVNKDKRTKEKLSNIIDPKNLKWAQNYIPNILKYVAKDNAEKAALKGKKKLTHEEIGEKLKKSARLRNIISQGNAWLVQPPNMSWRLVYSTPQHKTKDGKRYGRSYTFDPSTQGRVKLAQRTLYGMASLRQGTDVNTGYPNYNRTYQHGIFNTVDDAIRSLSRELR